jgi:hypothetical protein
MRYQSIGFINDGDLEISTSSEQIVIYHPVEEDSDLCYIRHKNALDDISKDFCVSVDKYVYVTELGAIEEEDGFMVQRMSTFCI